MGDGKCILQYTGTDGKTRSIVTKKLCCYEEDPCKERVYLLVYNKIIN
jgi:hypothetical protein